MPRRRATTPSPSNAPPRVPDAMRAARLIPALDWLRAYDRDALASDLLAAVIVTIMLIPQSLAYAMLAGLPPVCRALRQHPAARGLCAVRLEPGARGRAGRGGLADDRSRDRQDRDARQPRVPRGGDRARRALGAVPAGARDRAPRLSRQPLEPPGDLGLHHRIRHPDRREPAPAHPGGAGRRRHAGRDRALARRARGQLQPADARDRRARGRLSCSGCARD